MQKKNLPVRPGGSTGAGKGEGKGGWDQVRGQGQRQPDAPVAGKGDRFARRPGTGRPDEKGTRRTDGTVAGDVDEGAAEGETRRGPAEAPYVAGGMFSLPVALPEGAHQMHFTAPSGQAELSLWVVREDTIRAGTVTGAIVVVVVVVWGLWVLLRLVLRRRKRTAAA